MGLGLSLLIIWRKLRHNKVFSILNILGLGIGISVAVLVFLYADYELSFDRFNKDLDNIYLNVEDKEDMNAVFPIPFSETLKNEIPEVEEAASILPWGTEKEISTAKGTFVQNCSYMDESIFDIFSFEIIQQSQNKIFPEPNSVAVCESLANKLFGSATLAIGKDITISKDNISTISAVFKDIPNNSSLRFEMAAPLQTAIKEFGIAVRWTDSYVNSFVKLNSPVKQLEPKISAFAKQHNIKPYLFPLAKLHFAQSGSERKTTLYIAIFAGMFIMLLACINFINLSTANILQHTKEAGMNKLLGSSSFNMHKQFILEALTLTFIAFIVALVVSSLLLPYINKLIGVSLALNQLSIYKSMLLLAMIIGTSFLTAIVPAHIFAKAQPLHIFNRQINTNSSAILLRKGLLLLQLTLTITIIISTLFISKQVHFIDKSNLGFEKENLVFLETSDYKLLSDKLPALEEELLKEPFITSVCGVDAAPGLIGSSTTGFSWQGKDSESLTAFYKYCVGNDFINTFKVKLLEGKGFDRIQTNNKEVIINRTFEKIISGSGSALDKVIYYGKTQYKILGVIDDFSFNSIKEKQQPCIIFYDPTRSFYPCIRFAKDANITLVLAYINKSMRELFPDMKYDIKFTDDFILDKFIAREIRFSKFFTFFSFLGIIVCSIGLLGLALFESNKRIKEIGIRRVNGAHVTEIIAMLNKDYLRLIIVAYIFSTPVAWYAMHKWLQNFAYKTNLSWWIFALAGLLALGIALLTVSWQSWRAATRNPVEALRYE
jgi:ABC-type transport system, involved in lipoprotein release, permease component